MFKWHDCSDLLSYILPDISYNMSEPSISSGHTEIAGKEDTEAKGKSFNKRDWIDFCKDGSYEATAPRQATSETVKASRGGRGSFRSQVYLPLNILLLCVTVCLESPLAGVSLLFDLTKAFMFKRVSLTIISQWKQSCWQVSASTHTHPHTYTHRLKCICV